MAGSPSFGKLSIADFLCVQPSVVFFILSFASIINSESEKIQVPSWCGQEITGIKSLSNASLAKVPISELSVKDRIKIKGF